MSGINYTVAYTDIAVQGGILLRSQRSSTLPRSPSSANPDVSNSMKANISRNTGPELLLRAALRREGITGYRLNWKKAPGRPDIAFPGKRVAIFVNGCFWHHCPTCNLPLPKSNTDFWAQKFELNRERDLEKVQALRAAGWTVLVFWEHEIRRNTQELADKVRSALRESANINN